jgi:hypothetical protein
MNKWDFFELFPGTKEFIFDQYPLIKQHYHKIREIPGISEWINKRPASKI